jgi:hypothetical protein
LRGGLDRAVIANPVCLQVEAIALIDPAFGDCRAAVGAGDSLAGVFTGAKRSI